MITGKRKLLAILNTGVEKEFYAFDDGWRTIKHPGYYITRYMKATGKTVKEMTRLVTIRDNDCCVYARISRKDLHALRRGCARITPGIAEALEAITGISKGAWIVTQEMWDEVT